MPHLARPRAQVAYAGAHLEAPLTAEGEIAAAREAMHRLRSALQAAPRAAVLANYHMGVAGQRPFGGHFSPVVAYHEPSNSFLVLDCWPKTEPCWHTAEMLWAAMAATDGESQRSRGWVQLGQIDST